MEQAAAVNPPLTGRVAGDGARTRYQAPLRSGVRILLLCALDVWSLDQGKGAPTLERTLRAYGEAGHHVDAVLPDIGANHFYRGRGARGEAPESRPEIAERDVPHASTCRACAICRCRALPPARRDGRPEAALRARVPVARGEAGGARCCARRVAAVRRALRVRGARRAGGAAAAPARLSGCRW